MNNFRIGDRVVSLYSGYVTAELYLNKGDEFTVMGAMTCCQHRIYLGHTLNADVIACSICHTAFNKNQIWCQSKNFALLEDTFAEDALEKAFKKYKEEELELV